MRPTDTRRIEISPELLAAVFPPTAREPVPPTSLHQMAVDAIHVAEARRQLRQTRRLPVCRPPREWRREALERLWAVVKPVALVLTLAGATFAACDARAQDLGRAYPFARVVTLAPAPLPRPLLAEPHACRWDGPTLACACELSPEARAEVRAAEADLALAKRLTARGGESAATGKRIATLALERRRIALDSCRTTPDPAKADPYVEDPYDPPAPPSYPELDAFAAVYDVPVAIDQLLEKIEGMVRP